MPFPPVPDFSPAADPRAVVSGPTYRFSVLTARLIRLEYSRSGQFEDRPSQMAWRRSLPVPAFTHTQKGSTVQIETDYLLLRYRPGPFGFNRFSLSVTLKRAGLRPAPTAKGATWRYGDSPRKGGNLWGTTRTLDMFPMIKHHLGAGLLSRSGWAVVDDSHSLVFTPEGWLAPRRKGGRDLYFFGYGPDAAACLPGRSP